MDERQAMSAYLLDWTLRALSLFNTMAMLWLGLTIALRAQSRPWGTWAAAGGLAMGALFFAVHSTIVGRETSALAQLDVLWPAIWLTFLSLPYAWYLLVGWYAGVLRRTDHRLWLGALTTLGLAALAVLAAANPLPSSAKIGQAAPSGTLRMGEVPVAVLIYLIYSVLCLVLSLDALRHPGTSERLMGDLARRRARPWLLAAALVLLAVAFGVAGVAGWFLDGIEAGHLAPLSAPALIVLRTFDLLISALLGLAVVLVGRAVVAYELFTGKVLPRGELARQWRDGLIASAAFGASVGAALSLPVESVYPAVVAALLASATFALLHWRAHLEREQSVIRLRPFVSSEGLYEHLLAADAPTGPDAGALLRALTEDVLGARVAYLVPLGPLGPLVGPLSHGANGHSPPAPVDLALEAEGPDPICVPVDPERSGGAVWAVPLWSERGMVGTLLLGEKRDGRLYTQEEMELARATGERLVDTQASAELARRLVSLQRRRLVEDQVLDRRARRELHDEVLPRLHAALLALSRVNDSPVAGEASGLISDAHRQIAALLRSTPAFVAPEVARLGLVAALRQMVDLELGEEFDGVNWALEPDAEQLAQRVPGLSAEVVYCAAREVVRNAARHGRGGHPQRPLHLSVSVYARDGLEIAVEDDGVGIRDLHATEAGRGLALHGTMMAVIGGSLAVETVPDARTRVTLALSSG